MDRAYSFLPNISSIFRDLCRALVARGKGSREQRTDFTGTISQSQESWAASQQGSESSDLDFGSPEMFNDRLLMRR